MVVTLCFSHEQAFTVCIFQHGRNYHPFLEAIRQRAELNGYIINLTFILRALLDASIIFAAL